MWGLNVFVYRRSDKKKTRLTKHTHTRHYSHVASLSLWHIARERPTAPLSVDPLAGERERPAAAGTETKPRSQTGELATCLSCLDGEPVRSDSRDRRLVLDERHHLDQEHQSILRGHGKQAGREGATGRRDVE